MLVSVWRVEWLELVYSNHYAYPDGFEGSGSIYCDPNMVQRDGEYV